MKLKNKRLCSPIYVTKIVIICLSYKINETDKKFDKAKLANLALEQIEHKEYYQDHLDYSSVLKIYCFGICFCKKSCSVAFKEIKK